MTQVNVRFMRNEDTIYDYVLRSEYYTTEEGMESLLYYYADVAHHSVEWIEPDDILNALQYQYEDLMYEEVTDDYTEYEFIPDVTIWI